MVLVQWLLLKAVKEDLVIKIRAKEIKEEINLELEEDIIKL